MRINLRGISFDISFPLIAALSVVLIADKSLTAFCAVINAVLHELGHIITLYKFGCTVKTVKLSLFDINIKKNYCPLSLNREIAVALSGAAANILCFAFFGIIHFFISAELLRLLSVSALVLACFNLLPVESLDGGRALSFLMMKRISPDLISKILTVVSALILLPMTALGLILLLKSKYNFTLLFTSCYLTGIILLKKKSDYDILR